MPLDVVAEPPVRVPLPVRVSGIVTAGANGLPLSVRVTLAAKLAPAVELAGGSPEKLRAKFVCTAPESTHNSVEEPIV